MVFHSLSFIIFFILFLFFQALTKNVSIQWISISIFSLTFYSWYNPYLAILLILNGLLTYYSGLLIQKKILAKTVLIASISIIIGVLTLFKINYFFAINSPFLDAFTVSTKNNFIIPAGISFYTFQSISYLVDIFKQKSKPAQSFLHLFSYLSYFPQLVAGPILRAKHFLPQLSKPITISAHNLLNGTLVIVFGMFIKLVISDNISPYVNTAFSRPFVIESSIYWWINSSLFSIQIYCDFAGYSLIAIGLGRALGHNIPKNFYYPFVSTSISEFWQRWHISLTTWFRDYVFIYFVKSNKLVLYSGLIITFAISGLWHGFRLNFLLWGTIHGFILTLELHTRFPQKLHALPGGKVLCWLITTLIITISLLVFKVSSIEQLIKITNQMFSLNYIPLQVQPIVIAIIILFYPTQFILSKFDKVIYYSEGKNLTKAICLSILIPMIIFFRAGEATTYVYYNF